MHFHPSATAPLALSATALLLLTSCSGDEGLGDSGALSGIEVNHNGEDEAPEVVIYDEVEADENSSYVISQGDGEQVNSDWLLDYQLTLVDPESGDVQQSTHGDPIDPFMALPALASSPQGVEQFFAEGLTAEGVTVGSEVAFYVVADEAQGIGQPMLYIFEVLGQRPSYADGEQQEQSGDLPEIDSEIGAAPELGDHDAEVAPPSELSSEVLIAGEGDEIADDDYVFAQYRGWRWEDGEVFDQSWISAEEIEAMEEADIDSGAEEGEPGEPFGFSLTGGVIEGWLEGIPGHHVGDRILLVIPEDQAYGETADEEEGTTEDGGPGGTLIFVIDLVMSIDSETMDELQAAQQPETPEMPDVDQEVVAELAEEFGVTEEEITQMLMMGISPEELREVYQGAEEDSEDEADSGSEEDPDDSDDQTDDEDE